MINTIGAITVLKISLSFRGMSQTVKRLPTMRETRVRSGWGRSSGEGNGNPLQYSCLENPMDGRA